MEPSLATQWDMGRWGLVRERGELRCPQETQWPQSLDWLRRHCTQLKWQQRPVVVLESTVSLSPLKLLTVSVCFFHCGKVHVLCYSHPQQMSTSVWMVKSSLTMAMYRSVILAPLTPLLFSVILTDLHLLVMLVLEDTGLHLMGIEWGI